MKIVLSGVETNNKGAELMLYAILQEIERRWPDAEVFIPFYCVRQGLDYLHTNLNLRYTPFSKLIFKLRINAILRILHIPYGWLYYVTRVKDADWFLDGSGYGFSDLWNIKDGRVNAWETMLKDLHQHNCKIVFLPQAFGPVEQENTKRMLRLCNDYASLVIPREQVSYGHIVKSGVLNLDKVKVFTDFTSLVVFPRGYERLKNGICIIPNRQMILKGATTYDNYFQFLTGIIGKANNSGYPVYLLNHEGPKDAALALQCKERIGDGVEVVTGLNALEVKGLISSAYLVVSSRFHGLASSLNSCVPCLSTSWSFKYEELYKDYGISSCVLPINDVSKSMEMFTDYLNEGTNNAIRMKLRSNHDKVVSQTKEMWNTLWQLGR